MAKITLENGSVIEGTIEEFKAMGIKFPIEEACCKTVERLTTGDYAMVVNPRELREHLKNRVVKIVKDTQDCQPYEADTGNWFYEDELRKATEEEIAEEAERKQVEAKWAKIGRKVNEFKEGDVVECIASTCGHPVGTVSEIVYDEDSLAKLRVKACGQVFSHLGQMKLITPVESRFDR
ncbi:hypothetical protein DOE78_19050 [Bacillus sp. Y1]|nr:hypothetical protein [Bacillus sp. Y1]AYA77379.1 hypothetical protein DOE78_19050 [Bacillus sp. Y1]